MNATLQQWEVRLTSAQTGHYVASERYSRLNNLLGMPLVILSSFVSAFLFADQSNSVISLFLKCAGIAVALLASIQTFVRPAEKAELHRVKATKYGSLKRKVETFLATEKSEEDLLSFFKVLVAEWNAIAEDSPVTPHRIRQEIKKVIGEDLHRDSQKKKEP
ncbi:MAG: SLATT domain-containing protein [Verrucomicrobiae bacterium]|nr:SLATT domain-containing protein [Verrucomicrobiae bacterium]